MYNMKKLLLPAISLTLASAILCGCSRLSSEAKEMIGNYYIPEVSQDLPLMELNSDGTCVMRAIKPGVLTISVPGKWNVLRDTLFIENTPTELTAEGDTTLIGNIPENMAKAVINFSGVTLTLESDGVQYVYLRRSN
jgi:lipoprotein